MLKEKTIAPDFTLPDSDNNKIRLKDFRGKKVIIYFYPKDDTPGCTKEACSFKDNYTDIQNKNTVILGISPDSIKSHIKFKDKYNLNFYLLSDEDKKVIQKYEAYGEKKMYGKTYMGVIRSTYILDEEGKIIKVFPNVKVNGHTEEVLKYL